ncbi:hypothetical protein OL383_004428 [Salmonella enterica]|nr:hypothetical protein [Salmonella enterica]
MLPIEQIQDESEYKHACKSSSYEVSRILTYMIKEKKDQVFVKGLDARKREKLVKEIEHLQEIITTIQNVAEPTAPEMKF